MVKNIVICVYIPIIFQTGHIPLKNIVNLKLVKYKKLQRFVQIVMIGHYLV
jgi:hypothetical protein